MEGHPGVYRAERGECGEGLARTAAAFVCSQIESRHLVTSDLAEAQFSVQHSAGSNSSSHLMGAMQQSNDHRLATFMQHGIAKAPTYGCAFGGVTSRRCFRCTSMRGATVVVGQLKSQARGYSALALPLVLPAPSPWFARSFSAS